MKIELNQTTVTIAACVIMGVVMFGKDMIGSKPANRGQNTAAMRMQVSDKESSEARFKRENRNLDLPTGSELEQSFIDENIITVGEVPFGDNELEYTLKLPNSWVRSDFAQYGLPGEEKYLILTNIARYFGPAIGDVRPYFWLEAVRLKKGITARDFMHGYFANRGLSPETERITSETDAESLFVEVQNQGSYAVHGRFMIHGDTMVIAKMAVPVANYKKLKNFSGYVTNSFTLKNENNREIEKIDEFKLLNVLTFNYLESWKTAHVERKSTLKTGMELQNLHKGGGLNGVVYIKAYRKTFSLDETTIWPEIEEFLSGRGFSILEEKTSDRFEAPKQAGKYQGFSQKVYDITFKNLLKQTDFDVERNVDDIIRQTMYVTRFDNGNYIVYAILVTPYNNQYYMTWAENMYSYNVLLNSIKIREKEEIQ